MTLLFFERDGGEGGKGRETRERGGRGGGGREEKERVGLFVVVFFLLLLRAEKSLLVCVSAHVCHVCTVHTCNMYVCCVEMCVCL